MAQKNTCIRSVCLELVAPDPEAILNQLINEDILLKDVIFHDCLTVYITVSARCSRNVRMIAERQGAACKVLHREGFAWEVTGLLHRPVLLWGGILFLVLNLFLSGRILRIEVIGNDRVPTQYILQSAELCGIRFGSSSRSVRSEKTKNQILKNIPQLQWVGINTKGNTAVIQVKERNVVPAAEEYSGVACIVAIRDGIISGITVEDGTPQCAPGQRVLKGDVLISGYADLGIKVTATAACGEVFAYTNREIQAMSLVPTVVRGERLEKHTGYRLRIGKKVINFCNHSGIPDATCDKMYLEYYCTLPGGFRLPVSLIKEICYSYEVQPVSETEFSTDWLEDELEAYLNEQMVAGEILRASTSTEVAGEYCRLTGSYFCHEMIGKVRYEEILGKYAENN